MAHLLVTNDFPPKVGGIQSYLHELWRRIPPSEFAVFTTAYRGAAEWDAAQPFRVVRARSPFLAPTPRLVRRIDDLAREIDAELVILDPAWPLGAIGPELERPYGLILHGAEVTVPARIPFAQLPLRRSMRGASLIIASGEYPAAEGRFSAGRPIDAAHVPPGVDAVRFRPLTAEVRQGARTRFGITGDEVAVLGVSRLVRRKGFDVLIAAAAHLAEEAPDLDFTVLIAGAGRDEGRLKALISQTGAPVRLLGKVSEEELPLLYGAADVFAMLCRDQWGGLEQEGFGIVFLEAAAAGLPALAGSSGGSAEAVADGETGVVIDDPRSSGDVRDELERLVTDAALRRRLGAAARERAVRQFSYDILSVRLHDAITATIEELRRSAAAAEQAEVTGAADPSAGAGPRIPPLPGPSPAPAPGPVPVAAPAPAPVRAVRPIPAPSGGPAARPGPAAAPITDAPAVSVRPGDPLPSPGAGGSAPSFDLRDRPLDLTPDPRAGDVDLRFDWGPPEVVPGPSGGPGGAPLPRRRGTAPRSEG